MEVLSIKKTSRTPSVLCDSEKGLIEIKGRFIPENPIEFCEPLQEWFDYYTKKPASLTTINLNFDYFNTACSKSIFEGLKRMENVVNQGFEVIVNWYCEDEEMEESAEDMASIIQLPFNVIRIERE